MSEATPKTVDELAAACEAGASPCPALDAQAPACEGDVASQTPPPQAQGPQAKASGAAKSAEKPPRQLPEYARSLLRIRVPVVVTLAENRQPLHRIVELGPGSIIQFDKSCEEMLELSVGGHPIAQGEAVKVGDKFGLRITSMVLPEERFQPVKPAGK